jgi:hypothetical protein
VLDLVGLKAILFVINRIKLHTQMQKYSETKVPPSNDTPPPCQTDSLDVLAGLYGIDDMGVSSTPAQPTTVKQELQMYLAYPAVSEATDPLIFWEVQVCFSGETHCSQL